MKTEFIVYHTLAIIFFSSCLAFGQNPQSFNEAMTFSAQSGKPILIELYRDD